MRHSLFLIEFTEEDFRGMERGREIPDLQNDSADSDAGPAGSGMIGRSVNKQAYDESRVSDKGAIAVRFGCTCIVENKSGVLIKIK